MDNPKVIVATPGGSFFRDPHLRAFEQLGYNGIVFNTRHGFAYSQLFRKISRRMPALSGLKKLKVDSINKDLIKVAKRHRPKFLFVQKGETISPDTIETVKALGVTTINFYNDLDWSVVSKIAPYYDFFFTQHQIVLERLWKELSLKNCFYMAHAAEPLADPFTDRKDKYPISFIGTHNNELYPNREKYLMAVKDFGLHVWGNDSWLDTQLRDCFHGRSSGTQRFDIYSRSKIVIDINWEHIQSNGISVRPFEVAASGACLFADLVKKDIRSVYEENKEFISFTNAQELRDKVKHFLEHDGERKMIAKAGYERTAREHTYIARTQQIFDTIKDPGKYLYKLAIE